MHYGFDHQRACRAKLWSVHSVGCRADRVALRARLPWDTLLDVGARVGLNLPELPHVDLPNGLLVKRHNDRLGRMGLL